MTSQMQAISIKLDNIRRKAHALYMKGFRDEAIELMRISRGEVKLGAGSELFGLEASDIKKAKTCTLEQRQIIAANIVDSEKFGVTEDDYHEATDKIAAGNPRWPARNPKEVIIKTVAKEHNVPESSLRQFMKKDKDWKYENPSMGPDFEHPDWHPDLMDELFDKG
jgi:hypothetical protein